MKSKDYQFKISIISFDFKSQTDIFIALFQQGVNKGLVADRLLTNMKQRGMLPDFMLCIGDDRSDEDMFEAITRATAGPTLSPVAEVFACTVGRKPSKAKYFLEDTTEILRMLQALAAVAAASEMQSINNVTKGFQKVVIE